jgi:hypothetical protein
MTATLANGAMVLERPDRSRMTRLVIGTGLLAPIAIGMPVAGVGEPVAGGGATAGGTGFLEPWVQPTVYTGFAWQGVTLVLAFVFYARVRWAGVFTARVVDVPRAATHPVQVVLANGPAVLGLGVAADHLAHTFGATIGLPATAVEGRAGPSGCRSAWRGSGLSCVTWTAGRRAPRRAGRGTRRPRSRPPGSAPTCLPP